MTVNMNKLFSVKIFRDNWVTYRFYNIMYISIYLPMGKIYELKLFHGFFFHEKKNQ